MSHCGQSNNLWKMRLVPNNLPYLAIANSKARTSCCPSLGSEFVSWRWQAGKRGWHFDIWRLSLFQELIFILIFWVIVLVAVAVSVGHIRLCSWQGEAGRRFVFLFPSALTALTAFPCIEPFFGSPVIFGLSRLSLTALSGSQENDSDLSEFQEHLWSEPIWAGPDLNAGAFQAPSTSCQSRIYLLSRCGKYGWIGNATSSPTAGLQSPSMIDNRWVHPSCSFEILVADALCLRFF